MKNTPSTLLNDEVTTLTGKVFSGDITPLVYEMLKDSEDIDSLITFLNGGRTIDVDNNKSDTIVREEGCNRLSTAEWLRNCEQL